MWINHFMDHVAFEFIKETEKGGKKVKDHTTIFKHNFESMKKGQVDYVGFCR